MNAQERKVMEQTLEALEQYHSYMEPLTTVFGGPRVPAEQSTTGKVEKSITALRQCLEQCHHGVDDGACKECYEQQPSVSDEPVASSPYNEKRIGWELERTAMGDGYYGSAIRAAMDFDCVTANDMTVLQRYAAGVQRSTDHIRLQEIAIEIYNHKQPATRPQTIVERAEEAFDAAKQRGWVGLTDAEIMDMYNEPRSDAEMIEFARAIEKALKDKNT